MDEKKKQDAKQFIETMRTNIPEDKKADGNALVSAFISGLETMKMLQAAK